jgi:sulfur carrier protein
MRILVNGDGLDLENPTTLAQLLERLDLSGKRIALEVNEVIIPRSRFSEHRLRAGDRVEIVHAIGGG